MTSALPKCKELMNLLYIVGRKTWPGRFSHGGIKLYYSRCLRIGQSDVLDDFLMHGILGVCGEIDTCAD